MLVWTSSLRESSLLSLVSSAITIENGRVPVKQSSSEDVMRADLVYWSKDLNEMTASGRKRKSSRPTLNFKCSTNSSRNLDAAGLTCRFIDLPSQPYERERGKWRGGSGMEGKSRDRGGEEEESSLVAAIFFFIKDNTISKGICESIFTRKK